MIDMVIDQLNETLDSMDDLSKAASSKIQIRMKEKVMEAGFSEDFAKEIVPLVEIQGIPYDLPEEKIEKIASFYAKVISRFKIEFTDKHFDDKALKAIVKRFSISGGG